VRRVNVQKNRRNCFFFRTCGPLNLSGPVQLNSLYSPKHGAGQFRSHAAAPEAATSPTEIYRQQKPAHFLFPVGKHLPCHFSAPKFIFLPSHIEQLQAMNANIAMSFSKPSQNSIFSQKKCRQFLGSKPPGPHQGQRAPWRHGLQTPILALPL